MDTIRDIEMAMKRIAAERDRLSEKGFWDWTPENHHRDTVLLESYLLYEKMLKKKKK